MRMIDLKAMLRGGMRDSLGWNPLRTNMEEMGSMGFISLSLFLSLPFSPPFLKNVNSNEIDTEPSTSSSIQLVKNQEYQHSQNPRQRFLRQKKPQPRPQHHIFHLSNTRSRLL
jgi:hypothetical protein